MLINVISVDEVANGITSFYLFIFFEQTVLSVLTIYKNEKKNAIILLVLLPPKEENTKVFPEYYEMMLSFLTLIMDSIMNLMSELYNECKRMTYHLQYSEST